jgi:acyl-coenzyme A synthetase/AMP-(fatty) acid ligase
MTRLGHVKAGIDEAVGDLATLETIVVVRSTGSPCTMRPDRDVWYDELLAGASRDAGPRGGAVQAGPGRGLATWRHHSPTTSA